MREVLSSLVFEQFILVLRFESGSTVTAFSLIRFLDADRKEISTIDVVSADIMHVPVHRFLGNSLICERYFDGKIELDFGSSGIICMERVHDEPEVALVMLNGDMRVVI